MLSKEQKKQFVQTLRSKIKANKLAIFCAFEKIPTERQRKLKNEFREIKGEISVTKRRLLQRAFKEEGIRLPEIIGPVMIGFSPDEILPAKIIKNFPQKKERLDFIGGIVKENKEYLVLSKEDLEETAILPTKEEVFYRLIGALRTPISKIYFLLGGNFKKLSYILTNIPKQ